MWRSSKLSVLLHWVDIFFFWFGLVMGGFTCGFYIAMVFFAEVGVKEVSFLFFYLFWRGRACVYKGMDD